MTKTPRHHSFFHPQFCRRLLFRTLGTGSLILSACGFWINKTGYIYFLFASALAFNCAGDLAWDTVQRAIRSWERVRIGGRQLNPPPDTEEKG